MARKFMIYDVISCEGIDEAFVSFVGIYFLNTNYGWISKKKAILVRPFNNIYKGQFEGGDLELTNEATEDECLAFINTSLALSRIMEK